MRERGVSGRQGGAIRTKVSPCGLQSIKCKLLFDMFLSGNNFCFDEMRRHLATTLPAHIPAEASNTQCNSTVWLQLKLNWILLANAVFWHQMRLQLAGVYLLTFKLHIHKDTCFSFGLNWWDETSTLDVLWGSRIIQGNQPECRTDLTFPDDISAADYQRLSALKIKGNSPQYWQRNMLVLL